MPRITPHTIWRARAIDRSLPQLLAVCRDIRSAQLELRWLREHAARKTSQLGRINRLLQWYVRRRARGEPLQYILETEFFGELEMKCRSGVLIPRQETAASVSHLVHLIANGDNTPRNLGVLDLCTGTGCIPLLFHHEFFSKAPKQRSSLDLIGVDISPHALSLAQENLYNQLRTSRWNDAASLASLESTKFIEADVMYSSEGISSGIPTVTQALKKLSITKQFPNVDILISNPPYISSRDYLRTTSRSVRQFEPKLALVPPKLSQAQTLHDGDVFYPRILDIAEELEAKAVLLEVADLDQAVRVADAAIQRGQWGGIEIWRDDPANAPSTEDVHIRCGERVKVVGSGHGRSVFLYRREAKSWLGK